VILDDASGVRCGELRDFSAMIVVIKTGGPGEGGVNKSFVTNSIRPAESGDHHAVGCDYG